MLAPQNSHGAHPPQRVETPKLLGGTQKQAGHARARTAAEVGSERDAAPCVAAGTTGAVRGGQDWPQARRAARAGAREPSAAAMARRRHGMEPCQPKGPPPVRGPGDHASNQHGEQLPEPVHAWK